MIHAYYLIKSVRRVLSTEIRCDWPRKEAADKDSMLVMTVLFCHTEEHCSYHKSLLESSSRVIFYSVSMR